eukprot:TRINITY_DN10264_c0_g2_i1.p1 TRINITY_DN10264_c0_g2~~TRINITY_DN10264_c0_g2_i1.p1  ORF type:complete len:135 (+),score=28.10 TRINITY_DN10264_c0_g2_i1:549-953(+)
MNMQENREKALKRMNTEVIEENKAIKNLKEAAALTMADGYNSARKPHRGSAEIKKAHTYNKPQGESIFESKVNLKCKTAGCDYYGIVEEGTTEFLCNYCTANSESLSKNGKEPNRLPQENNGKCKGCAGMKFGK